MRDTGNLITVTSHIAVVYLSVKLLGHSENDMLKPKHEQVEINNMSLTFCLAT